MSHEHTNGHSPAPAGASAAERTLALLLGLFLIISGLGMGVSAALLPFGVTTGAVGVLLLLWGLFYATPAPAATIEHGHGAGGH